MSAGIPAVEIAPLLLAFIAADAALFLFAIRRPWAGLIVLIGGLPFNGLLLDVIGPRIGVVDPNSLSRIALAAWHNALALGIIAAAGLAILRTRSWRPSRVELAAVALLALAFVPLLRAPSLLAGLYVYRTLYLPIALMVAVLALARTTGLPRRLPGSIATAVVASGVIASAYAWVQVYVLGFPYILAFPFEYALRSTDGIPSAYIANQVHQPRAFGTFHSPNEFGAYLFIAALVTVTSGILNLGRWRPWIALALAITMVLTFSRSAWVSSLVGVAIVVLIQGWRPSLRSLRSLRSSAAIGMFLVATGIVLVTSGGDRFLIATLTGRDPSAAARIGQFNDIIGSTDPQASRAPGASPSLAPGSSPGASPIAEQPEGPSPGGVRFSWLGDGLGTTGTKSERFGRSAQPQTHSDIWYVTYTMQVGVAGLLVTGAFVVIALLTLWKTRSRPWSVLASGMLVGIGAGALFIPVVNEPAIAVPLWTLAGLAIAQSTAASGSAGTVSTSADTGSGPSIVTASTAGRNR